MDEKLYEIRKLLNNAFEHLNGNKTKQFYVCANFFI